MNIKCICCQEQFFEVDVDPILLLDDVMILSAKYRSCSFFTGANCRKAIAEGRGDFVPIFLGEIPLVFHRKIMPVDVAMVTVSPPDEHGYCSLGTSVDTTRAALIHAKHIIGQVC